MYKRQRFFYWQENCSMGTSEFPCLVFIHLFFYHSQPLHIVKYYYIEKRDKIITVKCSQKKEDEAQSKILKHVCY